MGDEPSQDFERDERERLGAAVKITFAEMRESGVRRRPLGFRRRLILAQFEVSQPLFASLPETWLAFRFFAFKFAKSIFGWHIIDKSVFQPNSPLLRNRVG